MGSPLGNDTLHFLLEGNIDLYRLKKQRPKDIDLDQTASPLTKSVASRVSWNLRKQHVKESCLWRSGMHESPSFDKAMQRIKTQGAFLKC